MTALKRQIESLIPSLQSRMKELLKNFGNVKISDVTISQIYGGARGIECLLCETSLLDPEEGIRFRGYSIPELREKLPKAKGGKEPLPEGIFYLMVTGDIPTEENVAEIAKEWQKRSTVPDYVFHTLDALPKETHPMTQLSLAILALQNTSEFAKKYQEGIPKNLLWVYVYEDSMNLIAQLPVIAAYIYRRTFKDKQRIPANPDLDWAANFAHMMGIDNPEYYELMRLFLFLHADHEGGNVSAHATHLVGSALSDPYYSLSAGINGLAGPLHGLANQEVLRWLMDMKKQLGEGIPDKQKVENFVWETLNKGQVIPGFGHAVLRKTDPRYIAQREFALAHFPEDELFQIVSLLFEVVPGILMKHGKAKNPWPNVDAHSGCMQVHYGVTEYDFYTVFFGVSRAMGVLASLIWSRALGLSIERPKSVTTEYLESLVIQWDEKYNIGIPEIDQDHREFVNRIQKLIQATNQGSGAKEVQSLILFLEDYVMEHFGREERLMIKYDYPGFIRHRENHTKFIHELHNLKTKHKQEGWSTRLVILTKQVVMDWFKAHTTGEDKKLGDFLDELREQNLLQESK